MVRFEFCLTDMKNDYLWDKSGSDPAIERIEKSLKVCAFEKCEFRVNRDPMPTPQKTAESLGFSWRWLRSPSRAFAAAVILFATGIVLVFLAGERDRPGSAKVRGIPVGDVVVSREALREDTQQPTIEREVRLVRDESTPKPRTTRLKLINGTDLRPRVNRRKTAGVSFSAEEKRAYRQLMFALSLTGEKLRLVNDAVNGQSAESAREPPPVK